MNFSTVSSLFHIHYLSTLFSLSYITPRAGQPTRIHALQLRSSLRNTLATFGPQSPQYKSTEELVKTYISKKAQAQPDAMKEKAANVSEGVMFTLAHRPKPAAGWGR
jgi:hypothetical protein